MNVVEIILIAIALSMDAFAVSIVMGLSVKRIEAKTVMIPGLYFGIFQAIMPLVGYFSGICFAHKIQNVDHWIAFVLLVFIGGKMLRESFSKMNEKRRKISFKPAKMLILSIATSIDALAIGITFILLSVNIYKTIAIIGLTTFLLSACGIIVGNRCSARFTSKAEFIGGAILVIIGCKILIEHLWS